MAFIAPQPWHPFFGNLDPGTVAVSINKRLTYPSAIAASRLASLKLLAEL